MMDLLKLMIGMTRANFRTLGMLMGGGEKYRIAGTLYSDDREKCKI